MEKYVGLLNAGTTFGLNNEIKIHFWEEGHD